MSGDDIRRKLEIAGRRLADAEARRAEAMAELAPLVRSANTDHRLDKAEIARLAHISRPTVYKILKEKP